jgi:hypothetical protein
MKFRFLLPIVASLLAAAPLPAQDKPAKPAKPAAEPPNMDEMMKKWMAAATPGPAHKALESLVGEWDVVTKVWMAPGAPPTETKGSTTNKWILGGRFLQSDMSGEMMGMPMTGFGLTGYDNFKKKYFNLWADNLGTGMYLAEGTADAAGKVFTYHVKMDDVMTGEKDKPFKYIQRIESADRHFFEMHDLTMGEKSKMLEITYTRKKK